MKKEYITPETIKIQLASALNILAGSGSGSDEMDVYDEYTDSPALSKKRETDLWEE